MAEELATYQFQLDQVDEALAKDPENAELQKLRGDLTELINLYSNLAQEQQAAAASEIKKKRTDAGAGAAKLWGVGSVVMARYHLDGKYYEAVVDAVPEDPREGAYSVTFKGYGNQEAVNAADIRDPSSTANTSTAAKKRPIEAPKTAATIAATNPDINKKKKKFKPKDGAPSKRDKEQMEKQQAWLSFASGPASKKRKSTSAGATKPILKKPSIFATPDDPMAKVGVVGSGKPMTNFQQRGKHIFQVDE